MSRSTRDLRELICMSRLSYHGEDDNGNSCSDLNYVDNELNTNPVPKETTSTAELTSKKYPKTKVLPAVSPPLSTEASGRGSPLPPIRKTKSASSESSSPVSSGRSSPSSPNGSLSLNKIAGKRPLKSISGMKPLKTDFDSLLVFFDATVISDWLTRANKTVQSLTSWLHSENNFVNFANFWLTEVSPSKRCELVSMEYSIIMDELHFAFGVGIQDRKLTTQDVSTFMSAVLWEYPQKFSSTESGAFFLNILMCLCCGRKENYKALLSDVKCSTTNKQFVQFVLATRAFAIVSFCSGIIDFYKQIHSLANSSDQEEVSSKSRDINSIATDFAFQAIQKGFVEVFQYFMLNYELKAATETTADGKCFLFAAVLSGQEQILRYLLKMKPHLDVNKRSLSSGNTPLHAAVNAGNTNIVKLLVEAGANVNSWNGECEGAAPLHWAVISGKCYPVTTAIFLVHNPTPKPRICGLNSIMTGNTDMVSALLFLGCDPTVKMGIPASVTPLDLAKDLCLDDVVSLLQTVKISE